MVLWGWLGDSSSDTTDGTLGYDSVDEYCGKAGLDPNASWIGGFHPGGSTGVVLTWDATQPSATRPLASIPPVPSQAELDRLIAATTSPVLTPATSCESTSQPDTEAVRPLPIVKSWRSGR